MPYIGPGYEKQDLTRTHDQIHKSLVNLPNKQPFIVTWGKYFDGSPVDTGNGNAVYATFNLDLANIPNPSSIEDLPPGYTTPVNWFSDFKMNIKVDGITTTYTTLFSFILATNDVTVDYTKELVGQGPNNDLFTYNSDSSGYPINGDFNVFEIDHNNAHFDASYNFDFEGYSPLQLAVPALDQFQPLWLTSFKPATTYNNAQYNAELSAINYPPGYTGISKKMAYGQYARTTPGLETFASKKVVALQDTVNAKQVCFRQKLCNKVPRLISFKAPCRCSAFPVDASGDILPCGCGPGKP